MTTMAMIEKLFVQIFERRSWIIDKVDQQARLFDQHLASNLLIDGITPPPWLLDSDLRSRTSELNAEELISGVLLSRPSPVIPFSHSQRPTYEETVARLHSETRAQNEDVDGREERSALAPNLVDVTGLASVGVSTMDHCITSVEGQRDEDPSITSPQDQRDTRISDVNHDLALSLARLQRSRSRQKDLQIRRSAKKVNSQLDDDTNLSGCLGGVSGSVVPSFHSYQLEESNLANPLDAQNVNCSVEGVKSSCAQSKENSGRIYSGRTTRSKSSAQRQSNLNVVYSSNAVIYDDALTSTVGSSLPKSSHHNPPLELVSGSQVGDTEARVGEKRKEVAWSSTDNRRVTRSRKVSRGASTIVSVPEALHSNGNEKMIAESMFTTSYRSRTSKGTQKVIGSSVDNRRTTRSRSKVSRDTSIIEPVLVALRANDNKHLITGSVFTGYRRGKGTRTTDEQASSLREDDEPCAANTTDSSDKETFAEEDVTTNKRAQPNSTVEVTSNILNSQDLGCRVTRSRYAASLKLPENESLYSLEATGSKVSQLDIEDRPCIGTKEPANLEGRASTLKEAEADLGRAVEAHSVSSGSSLNDSGAAELEVLAPFPAESSISVEPRQLNFDEVEPVIFNDISISASGNEAEEKLVEEKEPLALLEVAGTVSNIVSENRLENDSLDLEERDDLSTKEERSRDFAEANAEEMDAAIELSPKEVPCTENDMVARNLQQSNKCIKENSPLTSNLVTLQVARASLPEILLKQAMCSNISDLNTRTAMNLNSETKTGTPVGALPEEFAVEDVGPENVSNVITDDDFSSVTRPDHSGDQKTCRDIELPCAVPRDENVLNTDDTDVDCSHSSQRFKLQTEEVGFSLEERNSSANTPFTFAYEELEALLVPSMVRKAGGDCQLHLLEEARETDTTSITTDGDWQGGFDNGNSYLLEGKFGIGNTLSLTSNGTLTQEKKYDLTGTGKFSFDADDTMPVLEGFVLQSDDEQPGIAVEEIRIDNLDLPKTTIERASILEKLCKSACMQTPVTYSSASHKLNKVSNLYQSVPTGLLEGMDVKNKHPISEEFSCAFQERPLSDPFQNSTIGRDWDIKKPCLSPVQKVWERILSKSASSEKRKSLSLELPCINEESESIEEVADTYQGMDSELVDCSVKREPLAGIVENFPVSEPEPFTDRFSLNSVTTEFSFNGTHDRTKNNLESGNRVKRRYNSNNNKENENPSLGANSRNRVTRPLQNRFSKQKLSASTISGKVCPGLTEMEPRRNNIVSNITSFIPLVQQKQASTITTGKRDVKVKALEAAEAAKQLAEKKESERRIKKEAMKLERARLEQENLKQLELQKKRKEEERKKKEADMAAKKRQREEEKKKEKERKRLRVEETRKQQKENEQKLQAAKEEKDKSRILEERGREAKELKDEKVNNSKIDEVKLDQRISETEPTTTRASTSGDRRGVAIHEEFEGSSDLVNNLKVNNLVKPTATKNLVAMSSQEPSYDISPYKCSSDEEDEDEDDDDEFDDDRPRKFVPSWTSKKDLASVVLSQDGQSPLEIFPPNSFCSTSEVVLPGRFYRK